MKQLAVVVPALLDHDQRRYHFIDENGRIDDPMELYRQTKEDHNTRWDEKSKAEFTRAFVETPKQWHKIAAKLDGKTCSDCVKYYYLNKQREKYKVQVRKARNKKRGGKKALLDTFPLNTGTLPSPPRTRSGVKQGPKQWREDEIEVFIQCLRENGKDWPKLVSAVNSVKNPNNRDEKDAKDFFEKNTRKHKLTKILAEHKAKKEAEKSAKKDEMKKEEIKQEEKKIENNESKESDQKKIEENLQKKKTETEVKEEPKQEIKTENEPSKDEPKEDPKDRTALNSPGRTLPLPTVPGISPPTPRSIGPDSPRAGQRVASPIRPGTPQRGAPIELPILPGVRHPVPKVASPKPLSPTPNRRSPSASPSHVTRDKEISVSQAVSEQPVTSVTSVAPVTEVTTSTVSRRLPQSSPVAVQSVSSRGAPVKTQGTFVPPIGQQQNRPEVHVGQKRKIFEETTASTAQPSGQMIKSVAQSTKPPTHPPAKVVKTHQMSHQVISQATNVSNQASSNQQHVVKSQSVIQTTSNPSTQSGSIQPTHTAASHGMQRVIQQPKQSKTQQQQHQQQHVQQQAATAAAQQQAFLADRLRQQQAIEQQVAAQKAKQQQNQMIADQAAAQRQQEQLAVKQAAAAAQQQAVQQQQAHRQAAAQAKKTPDKKKSEQATGTKLQQKTTDVTASLSSKEYQEMILK